MVLPKGVNSMDDKRETKVPWFQSWAPPVPTIDADICTRCGLCGADCVAAAVDSGTMTIDAEACIGCGHCVAICPVNAVGFTDPAATLPPQDADDNAFATLVRMRRSIRRFRPEEISATHLRQMLDVVRFAPTAGNFQKVSVTVIATRGKVQEAVRRAVPYLRRIVRLGVNPLTTPLMRRFLDPRLVHKFIGYKRRFSESPPASAWRDTLTYDAPALFIFHAPKRSASDQDAVIWAATANYHAETLGIGTCWNGFMAMSINGSKALKEWLGIPAGNKVYSTLTAGYPAVEYQRPAPRKALKCNLLK